MEDFKTFASQRDFLNYIQESLGENGSKELAKKIWDYLWETAEHIALPQWGANWTRFLKDFDGWNLLQTIDESDAEKSKSDNRYEDPSVKPCAYWK